MQSDSKPKPSKETWSNHPAAVPANISSRSPPASSNLRLTSTNPTLQFPFLQDQETISFLKGTNVMFVLRGLPGSGKSTLAELLRGVYGSSGQEVAVCSADRFFVKNGVYRWYAAGLQEAHAQCRRQVKKACKKGRIVVVDNSNVQVGEMQPYFEVAEHFAYVVILVEPKTCWRNDVVQLAIKTEHGISSKVIGERLKQWDVVPPIFYRWFLNEGDSNELYAVARKILNKCNKIDAFQESFRRFYGDYQDILNYLSRCSEAITQGKSFRLHCTAHFCTASSVSYMSRESVRKSYGKVFDLQIIGFVVTPRAIGARVLLTPQQIGLWDQVDTITPGACPETSWAGTVPRLARLGHLIDHGGPSGSHPPSRPPGQDHGPKKSPATAATTFRWVKSKVPEGNFFQPSSGTGSRAHVTLGYAPGSQHVQAGLDQLRIVALEKQKGKAAVANYDLGDAAAQVCYYGKGQWVVYLKKQLVVTSLFTGFY